MIKSLVSILSLLCLAICFTSTQAQPALINGYQLNNYTTGSLTLTVLDLSRCYAGTMCAFDATMAMALSRRVFLTLYFPTGLADHVEMPIIVTVENPIVFTMTSVWPTIASQGYLIISLQCDPGSNNDYILDTFFAISEIYAQRNSFDFTGKLSQKIIFIGYSDYAGILTQFFLPVYRKSRVDFNRLPPTVTYVGIIMLSPNALYDSSYYAMSTLEIPILYFTGESDCARSTFSNALNLYYQTRPFYFSTGSNIKNGFFPEGLYQLPVCKNLVETVSGSTCFLLDASPQATCLGIERRCGANPTITPQDQLNQYLSLLFPFMDFLITDPVDLRLAAFRKFRAVLDAVGPTTLRPYADAATKLQYLQQCQLGPNNTVPFNPPVPFHYTQVH